MLTVEPTRENDSFDVRQETGVGAAVIVVQQCSEMVAPTKKNAKMRSPYL